jgi:hypothetical protein
MSTALQTIRCIRATSVIIWMIISAIVAPFASPAWHLFFGDFRGRRLAPRLVRIFGSLGWQGVVLLGRQEMSKFNH